MADYLYTSMNGALHSLKAQGIRANNLANANTTGFRRDFEAAKSFEVEGAGHKTSVMSQTQKTMTDFKSGQIQRTGRDLDVAIRGNGFLTVRDDNGNEAYTRAGNLEVNAEGQLTSRGRVVVGDGGEINIPEYRSLMIGSAGNISVTNPGGGQIQAGQLKLVNPEPADMIKGQDGLFRPANGGQLDADENVVVASGHLESSNVNPVDEMIASMSLNRTFDIQLKMMKTADENSAAGSRLVRGG